MFYVLFPSVPDSVKAAESRPPIDPENQKCDPEAPTGSGESGGKCIRQQVKVTCLVSDPKEGGRPTCSPISPKYCKKSPCCRRTLSPKGLICTSPVVELVNIANTGTVSNCKAYLGKFSNHLSSQCKRTLGESGCVNARTASRTDKTAISCVESGKKARKILFKGSKTSDSSRPSEALGGTTEPAVVGCSLRDCRVADEVSHARGNVTGGESSESSDEAPTCCNTSEESDQKPTTTTPGSQPQGKRKPRHRQYRLGSVRVHGKSSDKDTEGTAGSSGLDVTSAVPSSRITPATLVLQDNNSRDSRQQKANGKRERESKPGRKRTLESSADQSTVATDSDSDSSLSDSVDDVSTEIASSLSTPDLDQVDCDLKSECDSGDSGTQTDDNKPDGDPATPGNGDEASPVSTVAHAFPPNLSQAEEVHAYSQTPCTVVSTTVSETPQLPSGDQVRNTKHRSLLAWKRPRKDVPVEGNMHIKKNYLLNSQDSAGNTGNTSGDSESAVAGQSRGNGETTEGTSPPSRHSQAAPRMNLDLSRSVTDQLSQRFPGLKGGEKSREWQDVDAANSLASLAAYDSSRSQGDSQPSAATSSHSHSGQSQDGPASRSVFEQNNNEYCNRTSERERDHRPRSATPSTATTVTRRDDPRPTSSSRERREGGRLVVEAGHVEPYRDPELLAKDTALRQQIHGLPRPAAIDPHHPLPPVPPPPQTTVHTPIPTPAISSYPSAAAAAQVLASTPLAAMYGQPGHLPPNLPGQSATLLAQQQQQHQAAMAAQIQLLQQRQHHEQNQLVSFFHNSPYTRQLEHIWQQKYPKMAVPPAWVLHQFQDDLLRDVHLLQSDFLEREKERVERAERERLERERLEKERERERAERERRERERQER